MTLAVTQKPNLIVFTVVSDGYGNAMTGFYDPFTNNSYFYGYWSSQFRGGIWDNRAEYITSVSNTAVVICNAWGAANPRISAAAYY